MLQQLDELVLRIRWNAQGLIPTVVQDIVTAEVLMLAWMNAESLELSLSEKRGIYWSRSRQSLWRKGETSGNIQILKELRLDCDLDTLLLKVEQQGVACHTGRKNCFFYQLDNTGYYIDPLDELV